MKSLLNSFISKLKKEGYKFIVEKEYQTKYKGYIIDENEIESRMPFELAKSTQFNYISNVITVMLSTYKMYLFIKKKESKE